MISSKLRWLAAGVLAVVAALVSPGRSAADVQVLIQEANGSGFTTLFNGTVASNGQVTTSSANYSTINVQFANSNPPSLSASFSTSYSLTASSSGVAPDIHISAQDVGLTGTGIAAIPNTNTQYKNSVSNTSNISSTTTANISLLDFASNNTLQSNGYTVDNVAGFTQQSQTIPSPNANYSILQDFTVHVAGDPTGQTFTGGATTNLNPIPNPVPAPGGLLLAAFAAPVFGVRRFLRRKAAQ